jgi:hypothetical protein
MAHPGGRTKAIQVTPFFPESTLLKDLSNFFLSEITRGQPIFPILSKGRDAIHWNIGSSSNSARKLPGSKFEYHLPLKTGYWNRIASWLTAFTSCTVTIDGCSTTCRQHLFSVGMYMAEDRFWGRPQAKFPLLLDNNVKRRARLASKFLANEYLEGNSLNKKT